ncbi:PEP-CTERM sorting domain-containing protein [Cellvibrio sp. pealriver]|uniref:PEP-CTERM sorting domain-containing protein n=1 Tax=Cellvibrio sp. pealriver TaxID=1622269 RepID=UPI00066FBFB6|nr:PEP-CTERM sorting domain-containing protein [Cellvibrio sp. pealriver]
MIKQIFKSAVMACVLTSSAAFAVPVDLGLAQHYTLLSAGQIPQGSLNLGSASHVYGNVGARWVVGAAPGTIIEGDLHGGFINAAPGLVVTGETRTLSDAEWDAIFADIGAASTQALNLGKTGTNLGAINDSTTLNATGSLNVFNINGSINLNNGKNLTLKGSASDQFVINVSNDFFLCKDAFIGCDAGIILDGVSADNVLFNMYGSGLAQVNGDFVGAMRGNFISAGNFSWILGDGMVFDQVRILAGNIPTANVQDVFGITPPKVEVPEPSVLLMFGLGLLGLGIARRRA